MAQRARKDVFGAQGSKKNIPLNTTLYSDPISIHDLDGMIMFIASTTQGTTPSTQIFIETCSADDPRSANAGWVDYNGGTAAFTITGTAELSTPFQPSGTARIPIGLWIRARIVTNATGDCNLWLSATYRQNLN